jgi:hypothetical protein
MRERVMGDYILDERESLTENVPPAPGQSGGVLRIAIDEPKTPWARQVATRSGAILLAALSALGAYGWQFVDTQRKDKLTYVDLQLEKLYGPLYALTRMNDATFGRLADNEWKHVTFVLSRCPPALHKDQRNSAITLESCVQDIKTWRHWMTTVFQPINVKMEDAIVNNAQLVIGGRMPLVFQAVVADTETYKVLVSRWKDSDENDRTTFMKRDSNTGTHSYPNKITSCVERDYNRLKDRQQALESTPFSGIQPYEIKSACT